MKRRRGDAGIWAAGKTNSSRKREIFKGQEANQRIAPHQFLGTTLRFNHQLSQQPDESMTEIQGSFPIYRRHFLRSFHDEPIWVAGSEISTSLLLGISWPSSSLLRHRIWRWGQSWGENKCTIGRVTPDLLFIFGGQRMNCTVRRRISLSLSSLSLSLSKSHWLKTRER